MKTTAIVGLALLATTVSTPVLALDRDTVRALNACHDYIWNVPDFSSLPNAAITVYPSSQQGDRRRIHWTVEWDHIKASGSCNVLVTPSSTEVTAYEEDFKRRK